MKKKFVSVIAIVLVTVLAISTMLFFYGKITRINTKDADLNVTKKISANVTNIKNSNLSGSKDVEMLASLNKYVGKSPFSGTVSVVKDGEMYLQSNFGQKDNQSENTSNSAYRVNIQPLLNRAMVYKLINDGSVDGNTRLNEYFPKLKNSQKYSVNDLLRSRIFYFTSKNIEQNFDEASMINILDSSAYSTTDRNEVTDKISTFLLSRIISKATKSEYNTYVQSTMLNDFGVLDVGLMNGTAFLQNYVNNFPFKLKNGRLQYSKTFTSTIRYVPGSDNLYTTNADTLKVLSNIFNGGYLTNSEIHELLKNPVLDLTKKNNEILFYCHANGGALAFKMDTKFKNSVLVVSNVNNTRKSLSEIITAIDGK